VARFAELSKRGQLLLKINPVNEISRIAYFIKEQVRVSRTHGLVVGISGGIDSAVTAALCKKAVGAKRILGVFLFEDNARKSQDHKDAKRVARELGIRTLDIPITQIVNATAKVLQSRKCKTSRLTLANIKARVRMIILYAIANEGKLLVAGTGDRSESLIGYFTKFGDGGVDLLPIGHLYKTEVRALGTALRLPYDIVTKPSSPNLWPGHKASEELPADYDLLDKILTLKFDSKKTFSEIGKKTGASKTLISEVVGLNVASNHKRRMPPVLE
jgi:NAD+ synthase